MSSTARRLWELFEPLHAVTYFSPDAAQAAERVGYRGFWMGYLAFRLAPLCEVGAAVGSAVCYGFDPSRVAGALPDAWAFAGPEQALASRMAGATTTLRRICPSATGLDEMAELAWEASQLAECEGRVLTAANPALPRPPDPWDAIWQAATTLREHRGDGHNAVAAAVSPVQAHWLKVAADETDAQWLQTSRNWPDPAWTQGRSDLQRRGWLDAADEFTDEGQMAHHDIEACTDAAAATPWQHLGADRTARLADLLTPLASAVLRSSTIPFPNPIGLNTAEH